jgi:TonB family protein
MRFLTLIIALLAATLVVSAAEPTDRAAVPLHTPPLETPVEAAGTGIAPEVTVRVTIDASGRVTRVEIVKITPSTEMDGYFERSIRETLSMWRYGPTIENGEPVEKRMEWSVRFAEIGKQEEREKRLASPWRGMRRATEEIADYRSYLLSLPLEKRTEMLQNYGETALKHLDPKQKTKHVSPHFIVYSDAYEKEVAPAVAQNMEATFNVLNGMLQPWAVPYPEPYCVVVMVYRYNRSFEALKQEVRSIEWARGFYNPLGLIALQMEGCSSTDLMSTILHEATHAFLDRYVARPGVHMPRWLDEGLADYIGGSTIKRKRLVPGKFRRSTIYMTPMGMQVGASMRQYSLEDVKRAVGKGEAISLERLVSMGHKEFYRENPQQYYTLSWLLVHFLRHGEEEWATERFPQLVLYMAEGYPPLEALTTIYGSLDELEPRFKKYVLRF